MLGVDVGSVAPSWLTLLPSFLELSSFLYHTLTTMMLLLLQMELIILFLSLEGTENALYELFCRSNGQNWLAQSSV